MTPVRAAAARAERLRMLHVAPELLVLVNVWDVASARVVAAQEGCRAIATASHGVAAAYGVADGDLGADRMLDACGRIAAAVPDVPVTADLEAGYDDAYDTVKRALELGIVGCNLEDKVDPLDVSVARIEAAVQAGRDYGVPLVVNARTDVFIRGKPPKEVADEAVERGRAYMEAGADVFFAIGLTDREVIKRLVEEVGSVSLLASPRSPSLAELADLGVMRVSVGPGAMGIAYAALGREAASLLGHGPYPSDLVYRP